MSSPSTDKELLGECVVETFRSSGSGGQHVQKTDSAVRLRHIPTGIVVTDQSQRSQYQNKLACLEKLREKIKKLNQKKKRRIPTKKPRSAKEEVLKAKTSHSEKKKFRKKPSDWND